MRYGLKRMRTSLSSFISLALSVPVTEKQRVYGLYPFLDSVRTVLSFICSLTKLANETRGRGGFLPNRVDVHGHGLVGLNRAE